MIQSTPKPAARRRSKGRILLMILGALAALAILAFLLLPKLLINQATQKPDEAGTFVTRQLETTTTTEGGQTSVSTQSAPDGSGQISVTTPGQPAPALGDTQAAPPLDSIPPQAQIQQKILQQVQAPAAQQAPPAQQAPADQTAGQPVGQAPADVQAQPPAQLPPDAPVNAPVGDGRFRVQMSETEISGMIFNGINQGTAPEFRASVQGVSTKIENGRARITVALLPKYLPDAFLHNLPGVTRETPTVYLGGEMSLSSQGNAVVPEIHQLSLGNFRVPMPFIRDAVRATIQQQADQMLRLPNGQQARLDEIQLQNGAMTLIGRAQ